MRSRALFCCLIVGLFAALGVRLAAPAGSEASRGSQVQQKIAKTRGKIDRRKGTERVLTTDISRWSRRIGHLQGSITVLQTRESKIQSDLDTRRSQLGHTQSELRVQRARLTHLRIELAHGRKLLAQRLVDLYQADKPDLLSVVLDSKGFADLIDRTEFINRIQQQDTEVLTNVRAAKSDATATADRLDSLENRQQALTAVVQRRRDQISGVKRDLIDTRVGYQHTKAGKARALARVHSQREQLESHLNELVAESNKIQARLSGVSDTPIKQGSGRFIWPVNGPITAPFCERRAWEACHPGMDIGVPTGTPIHAADGGTVRIAAWTGGYGNYTCIQHTATLSTCYGHQSVLKVHVGESVAKGQVIGLSGSTGFSTGPHLHFEVRINGAVTNPMNYL